MSNNQDIPDRRIYLVKPKLELMDILRTLKADDVITDLLLPHVVMTEYLPFEEFLEGYRKPILELCKLEFIRQNIFEYPIFPESLWANIPGIEIVSVESFDMYWVAEEAEYTHVPTTWI